MVVVRHQHPGVQNPPVLRDGFAETLDEHAAVRVGANDRPALVAATRDVPDRPGMLQAEGTCHWDLRGEDAPTKTGRSVGGKRVPRHLKPTQILYFLGLTPRVLSPSYPTWTVEFTGSVEPGDYGPQDVDEVDGVYVPKGHAQCILKRGANSVVDGSRFVG
jgi:hypothetical protein